MKIDSSRFNAFWANPDAFRLREYWRLAPEEPKADTFASLLTFGRRRGTCVHELLDAAHKGIAENEAIQSLRDGGFGEKEISVATNMARAVLDRYRTDECLAAEIAFEAPIPGSPHSLVGRIDRIVRHDEEVLIRYYKTSKYRPKKEIGYKGEEYCRGTQVGFYLIGARSIGFDTRKFVYSLVHGRRDGYGVEIHEFPTERTRLELSQLMRSVHQTCELILWLKDTFGVEKSWPVLPERFQSGYQELLGKPMYEGFTPEGFRFKEEHLSIAEIF